MQKNRPVIYNYKMKFSDRIVSILLAVVLVFVCILVLQTVGAPYNKAGREGFGYRNSAIKSKCESSTSINGVLTKNFDNPKYFIDDKGNPSSNEDNTHKRCEKFGGSV